MNIGIVGARKYRDQHSIINLVNSLPAEAVIITSSCKGVCTWSKEAAEARGMSVKIYAPDLENIRAWFEIPKRYYQRNREVVEACDLLHAFISEDDGYKGGTRFEIEYAVSLNIPVQIHWENGANQWHYQYAFDFMTQKSGFFLSWQEFFCKTDLQFVEIQQNFLPNFYEGEMRTWNGMVFIFRPNDMQIKILPWNS